MDSNFNYNCEENIDDLLQDMKRINGILTQNCNSFHRWIIRNLLIGTLISVALMLVKRFQSDGPDFVLVIGAIALFIFPIYTFYESCNYLCSVNSSFNKLTDRHGIKDIFPEEELMKNQKKRDNSQPDNWSQGNMKVIPKNLHKLYDDRHLRKAFLELFYAPGIKSGRDELFPARPTSGFQLRMLLWKYNLPRIISSAGTTWINGVQSSQNEQECAQEINCRPFKERLLRYTDTRKDLIPN